MVSVKESQLVWKCLHSHMIILIFHVIARTKKDGMYLILHIRCVGIKIACYFELFHLQISALHILLSSQFKDHRYPPSWEFQVTPRDNSKSMSGQVTCKILINAGRTKLAQKTFLHNYDFNPVPSHRPTTLSYSERPLLSSINTITTVTPQCKLCISCMYT